MQSEKRFKRTILATCCLPWNEDDTLDVRAFRRHLTDIVTKGTPDVYLFGTAGEGYAVSDDIYRTVVDEFSAAMAELGGNPMIGVISLSTKTVCERIAYGVDRGVTRFQISLPSWGACTFSEVERFFDIVCGAFPACEFLHYNTVRAGRPITPKEYGVLAKAHPNFVATKSPKDSLRAVAELHRYAPELRHFLTEFSFTIASLLGLEAGFLISRAAINWRHARVFYEAGLAGDRDTIVRYVEDFLTMGEGFAEAVEPKSHMDGGYDKLFPMFADPGFSPRLLAPYGTSDIESFEVLKAFLSRELPHWLEE